MKNLFLITVAVLTSSLGWSQKTQKVLFLGNSYTYGNDLPKMVADIAHSMGDSLYYDQNTPGGYQLWQHSQNTQSLAKINADNWDYVILQEQSYVGTVPWARDNFSYPAVLDLQSEVLKNDSCSSLLMYMTWGRKNAFQGYVTDGTGAQHFSPAFQDYFHMQDSLTAFYMNIANQENIPVSPVGEVWRKMRTHYPGYDLYTGDGSHPNVSGTYVAACSFYASIFHKSPVASTFLPAGVDPAMADKIKAFTDTLIIQDFSQWNIDTATIQVAFTADTNGLEVTFNNTSALATDFHWDFGDGTTSTDENPIHTYTKDSTYTVTLSATSLCEEGMFTLNVTVADSVKIDPGTFIHTASGVSPFQLYPSPAQQVLFVKNITTPLSYKVLNLSGQTMFFGILSNAQSAIDISSLPNGIYILIPDPKNGDSIPHKFIKNE